PMFRCKTTTKALSTDGRESRGADGRESRGADGRESRGADGREISTSRKMAENQEVLMAERSAPLERWQRIKSSKGSSEAISGIKFINKSLYIEGEPGKMNALRPNWIYLAGYLTRVPIEPVEFDVEFADDLTLLDEDKASLQEFFNRVTDRAEKVGLHVYVKKTNRMAVGSDQPLEIFYKGKRVE
ncbi:hypothetical protein QYM36_018177, partial [Artemia franciscana]